MTTTTPPLERFVALVDLNGPVPAQRPELGPCHLWLGACTPQGYSSFFDGARVVRAHKWIYRQRHPTITLKRLDLDHLCRVRHCVNDRHLEPVTRAINIQRGEGPAGINARKAVCVHGHADLVVCKRGNRRSGQRRYCRTCDRARKAVAS